jgi:hypothetical protein
VSSWNSARLLGSALRPRTIHLHGVATAAAMLTCLAIVLDICPFTNHPGKAPGSDAATRPAENAAVPRQANESRSLARSEVDPGARPAAAEPESPKRMAAARPEVELDARPAAAEPEFPEWIGPSPFTLALAATPAVAIPVVAKDENDEAKPAAHEPAADQAGEPSRDAIVGVWAPGSCAARDFRDGMLPTIINAEGAWAGETFCLFSKRKQTDAGWSVVAKCQNAAERWTSNVRLTVSDNRLRWTSRRGTQTYTRCAPDVLMAEAR